MTNNNKPKYPPMLKDNILAALRPHVCGMTRKELCSSLGYYSMASLGYAIRDLISEKMVIKVNSGPHGFPNRVAYNRWRDDSHDEN